MGLALGAIGLLILLLVSYLHPSMAERVKFFTVNALSVLVLVAIVVQAIIYRRQWAVMESQRTAMQLQIAAMEWQAGISEIQAGLLDKQVIAMRDGLAETRKMVEQNERAVNAAEASAKHGEETLRISQRAYVGVKLHPILQWNEFAQPVITLFFANTGHTPAKEAELAFEFTIGGETFKHRKTPFIIAAHTDKSVDCVWRGGSVNNNLAVSGNTLFFEAELSYLDVWGEPQTCGALRYVCNPKTLFLEEFFESDVNYGNEDESDNETPN